MGQPFNSQVQARYNIHSEFYIMLSKLILQTKWMHFIMKQSRWIRKHGLRNWKTEILKTQTYKRLEIF